MTLFVNFKKASLALAIAVGFCASGAVHAGLVATAVLEVKNFQIQDFTTGNILNVSNFTNLSINDFGSNTASLTGFPSTTVNGSATNGAPMNVPQVCLGVICPGQNVFTHTTVPGGNQLARADSNLEGAPLTGLGQPTGATAKEVAEVLLTTSGIGGGDSQLGLNSTFSLTVNSIQSLALSFSADHYLRTLLTAEDRPGSSARASSALSFTIDQVLAGGSTNNVFSWSPDGKVGGISGGTEDQDGGNLNDTINSGFAGSTSFRDLAGDQLYKAHTTLLPGNYQFSINQSVAVNGTQVIPEPGTMLLAGVGLLGVVLSRRRAKKIA